MTFSVLLHLQGWAELHLLPHSGDSLLEGGTKEQSYTQIREKGQQLHRLTQVRQVTLGGGGAGETCCDSAVTRL